MLCPEVWNFPPPKIMSYTKSNLDLESVQKTVNMNSFYKSLVITCPDELQTPPFIEESVTLDSDYYKITDCPLTVFTEKNFIDNFVKKGKLYCLSENRDSITQNCAAITPDGHLILHIPEFIFQCLGLEGVKRPQNFREVKIDLKNLTQQQRTKEALSKLEALDFIIIWIPENEDVCPSSIAKYLYEQDLKVAAVSQKVERISPSIEEIPSIDAEVSELAEWIGMLALGGELTPDYDYVSSYSTPESDHPLQSTRISLLVLKGFFVPEMLNDVLTKLEEYLKSRDMVDYWVSLSIQSISDSPWRWNFGSPSIFQAHDSSTTVFLSKSSNTVCSIGSIKFS